MNMFTSNNFLLEGKKTFLDSFKDEYFLALYSAAFWDSMRLLYGLKAIKQKRSFYLLEVARDANWENRYIFTCSHRFIDEPGIYNFLIFS